MAKIFFAANVYLKSAPNKGTTSNFDGEFSLNVNSLKDTLMVSFIGYKAKKVFLSDIDITKKIVVVLNESNQTLKEVVIAKRDPISEKFSVKKISKLDVYFNPDSKGDPLNAILILPSSTNTDESANPTLRGGSADRSRVYINGSPVLNPVRNGQYNGLGNFSLLNTEIIDKQYVYASNPPLTYGNSSAGIVEIETSKKLNIENIQLSLALSNIGIMINKKINKKTFFQLYGNYQFPDLLIMLNKKSLYNLKDFSSQDIGLNFRTDINKNLSFNSYNYYIDESYKVNRYYFNFNDISEVEHKRFFTINSVNYTKKKSNIRLSTLFDTDYKNYSFGIINSKSSYNNFYMSLSHKYKMNRKLTFQYGFNYYNANYDYNETKPLYYYSINENSPYSNSKEKIKFNYSEIYLYTDYKINNYLGFSGAVRKNIFLYDNIDDFLSYQLSSFYKINSKNRFILGLGNYYSYSTPNYYYHNISLLNSKQISLDYYLDKRKYSLTSAIYYKVDKGNINTNYLENFDKIKSLGIEISFNYNLNKYFLIGVNNTFLKQKAYLNNVKYNTSNNLKYYIKSQITYSNFKYFTSSLSLITRPGNHYTKVSDSFFNIDANNYQPLFSNINSQTFNNYFKIDFTINKMFSVGNNPMIVFLSINNILNNKNQSSVYYNTDYSKYFYDNYQQRIIYFGLQYRLNHIF